MNVLIVYFSKHGHTERIATRICEEIKSQGHAVCLVDVKDETRIDRLCEYQWLVLGSPIYQSSHSHEVAKFIQKHRAELSNIQTAFFSVSLSAAGTDEQCEEAQACIDSFLDQCQWQPDRQVMLAGDLPYLRYNWFLRMMMKWIVWRSGGDTDSSRNYEYTDWTNLDRFARSLVIERNVGSISAVPMVGLPTGTGSTSDTR